MTSQDAEEENPVQGQAGSGPVDLQSLLARLAGSGAAAGLFSQFSLGGLKLNDKRVFYLFYYHYPLNNIFSFSLIILLDPHLL